MPTTKFLLREYFGPLAGLPCWNVKAEYGSRLSFNFGTPHLETREGNPDAKISSLKRRAVFVTGEFRLWVEMGAWEILENGKRIYHSDQSRAYLRRAASQLWHVYCHENCLTLLANWTLEYGPSKRTKPREIMASAAIYAA